MTQHPLLPVASAGRPVDAGAKATAFQSQQPGQAHEQDGRAGNSSLLLRLFTSQFFDCWLAVSYIFRYPDLVGVQHYLCNELRKFPRAEVEFFLPQLVHLLITRPNRSTAVESLLMDMSLQSTHVAMILYWYLQAYLSDLAPNPRTASFKHCQRIFNQVQELLFTDIAPELIVDAPEPVQHVYWHAAECVKSTIARPEPSGSLSARLRSILRLAPQVQENSQAALVGISATMASAASPALASTMGWLAVAQGQNARLSEKADEELMAIMEQLPHAEETRPDHGPMSLDDNGTNVGFSCRNYLSRATRQFQWSARQIGRRMSRSYGGSGDLAPGSGGNAWASHSSDDLAGAATPEEIAALAEDERLKLERRTGYFGAEIKFITSLMDISQRVCGVPRSGRQQSLKAELTLFNHTLDRNTCIPLWCSDTNGSGHHRIVRIPTEDTVVLNSAERAPYLLTLEVLEPDGSDHTECPKPSPSYESTLEQTPRALMDHPRNRPSPMDHSRDDSSTQPSPSPLTITTPPRPELPSSPESAGATPELISGTQSNIAADDRSQPISPVAAADVDEKLMAEVFGDIDDFSNIPDSPLSPEAGRRRSGSYSRGGFGAKPDSTKRHLVAFGDMASTAHERPARAPSSLTPLTRNPRPANRLEEAGTKAAVSRTPVSQEEIRARMRTASILLAQLARQQKALGIKVADLVVPQPPGTDSGEHARSKGDALDTTKRRGKLGNATAQALVMEDIREKLVHEMMQLEELRLKNPGLDSSPGSGGVQEPGDGDVQDSIDMHEVEFKDDPSAKVLKEDWTSKKARIRRASPFGRQKNWNLLSVIVKEGADLRQEQLALQLIREIQRIWDHEQTGLFVQYYRIMVTGEGCGLMETIINTVSVHSIKKEFYSRNPAYAGPPYTLYNYFVTTYGTPDMERFREAQDCFIRSLVSYSLITYILQIRDRHNGNILLDTAGHVIHIDFGFMLYNSPGSVGFEQAPFKFPMEYVDILGGRDSAKFAEFRNLLVKAFLALRKHADNICLLVEMMVHDSSLPCLGGGLATVAALRDRFHLALSEQQIEELVDSLLVSSCDNITTRMYDAFQYYSNGVL
ncbi:Phosphatidylinositol 4-kinase pik1alpha (PI4-kinase)(PtdIns-4-kinase) [Coemansia sp. RSA 552]|nr:Phosphatidylinositol 4-kinase pik1alpha (PI4-kinase)(PtdIns-4-kinase) [Coemansia sp. RSA 552]